MKKFLHKLLPYVVAQWPKIVASVLLGVFLAAMKGLQAYLVKPIFDKGLGPESTFNEALFYAGVLLLTILINFPARFFHFYWIRGAVETACCQIREQMYRKFQRLPMSFYTTNKQGTLISNLLNDTIVFSQGLRGMVDLVREPFTAIAMFAVALWHDWQLTIVVVAVSPLFILIFTKFGRMVRVNQSQVQEELSHMTHNATEGIMGQKITKAFNLEDYIKNRFIKSQNRFLSAQMKTIFKEEMAHPLVELVGGIAFFGVIIFAWYRITSGALSPGGFISFIAALALLMDPIRKFSQANIKLYQAQAGGDRIFDLLALPEEIDHGGKNLLVFSDKIEIKNLSFSYDGEHRVLSNLSLTIKKGQKVAFVGLSGSGKSTLINLLLRLYPIKDGEILIDGEKIDNITLSSLRDLFALVSQDIFLFHDTIHENLTVGQKFKEHEIATALKVAYVDNFVDKLPQGVQTIIGDRGTRLSGGQQQRLTIARAFLKNANILLFDEATAALDNESEKVVQKALEQIASEKTVIAIAHRLSTIQEYDQIFVMNEGQIVEHGTHDELMKKEGEYFKLYELGRKN